MTWSWQTVTLFVIKKKKIEMWTFIFSYFSLTWFCSSFQIFCNTTHRNCQTTSHPFCPPTIWVSNTLSHHVDNTSHTIFCLITAPATISAALLLCRTGSPLLIMPLFAMLTYALLSGKLFMIETSFQNWHGLYKQHLFLSVILNVKCYLDRML